MMTEPLANRAKGCIHGFAGPRPSQIRGEQELRDMQSLYILICRYAQQNGKSDDSVEGLLLLEQVSSLSLREVVNVTGHDGCADTC